MARDKHSSARLKLNGLALDQPQQELNIYGETHHLTPKECQLLATFMQHPDKVLSREFLMREVWETTWVGDCATLEVHVCWLRKKIEKDSSNPQLIQTVRGVGYVFTDGG